MKVYGKVLLMWWSMPDLFTFVRGWPGKWHVLRDSNPRPKAKFSPPASKSQYGLAWPGQIWFNAKMLQQAKISVLSGSCRCVLMFSTLCAKQKKVDKVEGGFKRHICRPLVPVLSHEPGKQCLKNNKHKLCHSFGKFCPFMSQQDHVVATPTSYPCPRPKIRSPRHPCLLAAFQ